MFVDPLGTYYITQDKSSWCGEPIQSFTLHKETALKLTAKTIAGLFDKGDLAAFGIEKLFNVVGGNSQSSILSLIKGDIISTFEETKFGDFLGKASVVKGSLEGAKQITLDEIAFELFERNNIIPTFSSIASAETVMTNMYNFIEDNGSYFLSTGIGGYSLYQLDTKITNSKDSQATINDIANSLYARNDIIMTIIKEEFIEILNSYSDRLQIADNYVENTIFEVRR